MGIGPSSSSSETRLARSNTQKFTNSSGTPTTPNSDKKRRRATLPLNLLFGNRLSRRVDKSDSSFATLSESFNSSSSSSLPESPTPTSAKNNSSDGFKETRAVKMGVDDEGNKTVNEYTIIRTLGKGSYGKVKLCMDVQNRPYVSHNTSSHSPVNLTKNIGIRPSKY